MTRPGVRWHTSPPVRWNDGRTKNRWTLFLCGDRSRAGTSLLHCRDQDSRGRSGEVSMGVAASLVCIGYFFRFPSREPLSLLVFQLTWGLCTCMATTVVRRRGWEVGHACLSRSYTEYIKSKQTSGIKTRNELVYANNACQTANPTPLAVAVSALLN